MTAYIASITIPFQDVMSRLDGTDLAHSKKECPRIGEKTMNRARYTPKSATCRKEAISWLIALFCVLALLIPTQGEAAETESSKLEAKALCAEFDIRGTYELQEENLTTLIKFTSIPSDWLKKLPVDEPSLDQEALDILIQSKVLFSYDPKSMLVNDGLRTVTGVTYEKAPGSLYEKTLFAGPLLHAITFDMVGDSKCRLSQLLSDSKTKKGYSIVSVSDDGFVLKIKGSQVIFHKRHKHYGLNGAITYPNGISRYVLPY